MSWLHLYSGVRSWLNRSPGALTEFQSGQVILWALIQIYNNRYLLVPADPQIFDDESRIPWPLGGRDLSDLANPRQAPETHFGAVSKELAYALPWLLGFRPKPIPSAMHLVRANPRSRDEACREAWEKNSRLAIFAKAANLLSRVQSSTPAPADARRLESPVDSRRSDPPMSNEALLRQLTEQRDQKFRDELPAFGDHFDSRVEQGMEWLEQHFSPCGEILATPFETAVQMKSVLAAAAIKHRDATERLVRWLMRSPMVLADYAAEGRTLPREPGL